MDFFSASVSGVSLVGGLEWRTLTGLSAAAKEIAECASDIGARHYVQVQNTLETTCGFLPEERRVELPKKACSLAAILAGLPGVSPDCVFVVQEDNEAVIVALRDGAPAPGFDGYGPTDEIIETARKFIQMSANGVTVYGNCKELDPVSLTLAELVAKSTTIKAARIRRIPRPWVRYSGVLAVVLLICGGAKFYYNYDISQKKLAAARLAYVNIEEAYAKNVGVRFNEATPIKASFAKIKEMLASTPVAVGGWGLSEIACQKDGCSYLWKNEFGTNRSFVSPPLALNLTYSNKGDSISYQIAFAQPLPLGVDIAKVPTLQQILRDVTGDLQEFRDFSVAQTFEAPSTDFGVPPELPRPPKNPYKEGAYELTGPWYAVGAVEKLPDAATFETLLIAIDAEQHLTFKIVGKYYVK